MTMKKQKKTTEENNNKNTYTIEKAMQNMNFNTEGLSAKDDVEIKWEKATELHLNVESKIQEADERIAEANELEYEAELEEQEADNIIEEWAALSDAEQNDYENWNASDEEWQDEEEEEEEWDDWNCDDCEDY